MHGYTVRTSLLRNPGHGNRIGLDEPAMGVRFVTIAGLSQGGDMIDVDSE
jgi:hypothetical protein